MQLVYIISATFLLGILFAAFVVVISLVRYRRRRMAQARKHQTEITCARCGYSLAGLPVARCPECGTLRGFTVGIDDLGLTPDERRQVEQRIRPQPPTTPPSPD